MTLTLELTPEEELKLKTRAGQAGMDEASYLRSLLDADSESNPHGTPRTGAEMIAFWEANNLLTGYGDPAIDSPELARQIRERFSQREPTS